jgi:hypothetical protein
MKLYTKTVKQSLVALTLGGLVLSSCTKDFEEINTDPNNLSKIQSGWLITAAQKRLMDEQWDEWINGSTGMYYAQYWAATSYTEESRYQIREGVNDAFYNGFYAGGLMDLRQAEILAAEEGSGAEQMNTIAVSKLLQAWGFHVVTDMYGDVPFSEALSGSASTPIFSPKYDAQSDVYAGIVSMIDEALAMIDVNTSMGSNNSNDIVYGGDMMNWAKFGNSLKMRVALRMADADPAAAQAAFEAAGNSAAGAFTSNTDNALFYYQGASPNNNPQNENWKTRQDFCPSDVMMGYLSDSVTDDPRRMIYGDMAAASGTYVGMPYGLDNANATAIDNSQVSMPGAAVLEATAPGVYIDYAEICFAMAEAIERGWTWNGAMSAQAYYEAGVTASMEYWGITDAAAIPAFITATPYDAADWVNVIGTQKWVALYMQGLQGWYEFRRLDFTMPGGTALFKHPIDGSLDPDITPTGVMFPTRMTYASQEYSLNAENVSAAAANIGGDSKAVRVWWDTK